MPAPESQKRVDAELAFERASVHQWANGLLAELEPLLSALMDIRQQYAERLQIARAKRRESSKTSRLAELPIQDLARRGSNIRVQPVLDQGIRTALDITGLDVDRLKQIPGIGDGSASQLADLARDAGRVQTEDLRPAADPSTWSSTDFDVVNALELWSWLAALLGASDVTALLKLIRSLRYLKRWTSWLGWLLSPPARRQSIRSRYATAWRSAGSPQTAATIEHLRNAFAQAEQFGESGMPKAEVIKTWRTSSASLIAQLEEFVAEQGTAEERDVLRHGLGLDKLTPDLVRLIESQHLDQQLLTKTLRVYQIFGAKFALAVGRALLGDDVGLGKTIEAIAAIAHAISSEHQYHHIVICPAQLIDNWLRELQETLPTIPGEAFREPGRDDVFRRWRTQGGVLVVSYRQANLLAQMDLPELGFVVADEAHYVKNPDAQRTKATAQLASHGRRALLMGATLLENKAEELISLSELVHPQQGIRLRQQFGDGSTAHLQPDAFRQALGGFYLRRNQAEVLDELPEIVWTDEPITVGRPEAQASRVAISEGNLMKARRTLTVGGGIRSAKIERLSEIVDECRAEDRKLLIFSYFREVLTLAMQVVGEDGAEIHGDIPQGSRERLMTSFANAPGFAALILQIMVGGEGLNLQSASVVVLMEPQYKPSTETQAVGRAHRMGQISRVVVHRLVGEDTIDARIVERTGFKAELFNQLAGHSALADAAAAASEANPADLLHEEQDRLNLPPDHNLPPDQA
jgi:superfamily II DNA or RNA helicase